MGTLAGLSLALAVLAAPADDGPRNTGPACDNGDRDIRPISRPEPYYPHSAIMFCLGGEVRLEFTVDSRGRTRDVEIIGSEPAFVFDRAAVDTIERWRFSPACREGQATKRAAVQTILFELPPDQGERCATANLPLDNESLRLISEVGARYALLAEFARGRGSWADIEPTLVAPFPSFDADMSQVAEFHRQVLASHAPTPEMMQVQQSGERLARALQPDAIAANPRLDAAREKLDRFGNAVADWLDNARAVHAELAAEYRRVERETRLDPATLDQLVTPFAGDFNRGFDDWAEPHLQTLDLARSVVEFLDQGRPGWQATGQALHFDREEDARTWHALRQDLMEHQDTLYSRHLAFLRSFDDYATRQ